MCREEKYDTTISFQRPGRQRRQQWNWRFDAGFTGDAQWRRLLRRRLRLPLAIL
jgi:hypothetical protein